LISKDGIQVGSITDPHRMHQTFGMEKQPVTNVGR
jgi:hypothetical protein